MQEIFIITREELKMLIKESVKDAIDRNIVVGAKKLDDDILNIEEAMEFLNLKRPTIYALTSKNKIPFHKTGKKLYFKKSELINWIERGREPPPSLW